MARRSNLRWKETLDEREGLETAKGEPTELYSKPGRLLREKQRELVEKYHEHGLSAKAVERTLKRF